MAKDNLVHLKKEDVVPLKKIDLNGQDGEGEDILSLKLALVESQMQIKQNEFNNLSRIRGELMARLESHRKVD